MRHNEALAAATRGCDFSMLATAAATKEPAASVEGEDDDDEAAPVRGGERVDLAPGAADVAPLAACRKEALFDSMGAVPLALSTRRKEAGGVTAALATTCPAPPARWAAWGRKEAGPCTRLTVGAPLAQGALAFARPATRVPLATPHL